MKLTQFALNPVYKVYERALLKQVKKYSMPKHVGIILDGNRRFANTIKVPLTEGYIWGLNKLEEVLEWLWDLNIKVVSVWIFSTDNFKREAEQVNTILKMAEEKTIEIRDAKKVHARQVLIRYSGDRESLPESLQKQMIETEKATEKYGNHILNICLAYGGRKEMIDAIKSIALKVKNNEISIDDINEEIVSNNLYTKGLPDPDLIIRTSGSIRLSGFMMWQSIYSELFFADILWPAFRKVDLLRAIRSYQRRKRNFGK